MSKEQIVDIVSASVEALTTGLRDQIRELTQQFQNMTPRVETYEPVTVNRIRRGSSLDLIKSLPEFKGESGTYPAWREAAHFAMEYYTEGTENFYIAMGIFRNKITGAANAKLSSYNTVLNFSAIISRLDQVYADKRSLQSLENEISILRQGTLSIVEFYDKVDQHLTLIINKNKMSYSNSEDIIAVLNERARDNALRVFISGLRHPLSDIMFSAKPSDLPTALATAQDLEANQRRQEFAKIYATGDLLKTNRAQRKDSGYPSASHPAYRPRHSSTKQDVNKSAKMEQASPMEVDPGSSVFRRTTAYDKNRPSQLTINKRKYEDSGKIAPEAKTHRVNYIESDGLSDYEDDNDSLFESELSSATKEDDLTIEELNFLE